MEKSSTSELLGKMDRAPSGRFHLKTIFVAGMGFFTDAYDLFILGTALPIIEAVYHVSDSTTVGLIGASALFGAFIGAILFGQMGSLTEWAGRPFSGSVSWSWEWPTS